MMLILTAMGGYAIVNGEDPEPQPLVFDCNLHYDDWAAKEAEATSMIRLSCSPKVRHMVKGIRNSHDMWNPLEISLDTVEFYIGRQDNFRQFHACRPKEDVPLNTYIIKLSHYCI